MGLTDTFASGRPPIQLAVTAQLPIYTHLVETAGSYEFGVGGAVAGRWWVVLADREGNGFWVRERCLPPST